MSGCGMGGRDIESLWVCVVEKRKFIVDGGMRSDSSDGFEIGWGYGQPRQGPGKGPCFDSIGVLKSEKGR